MKCASHFCLLARVFRFTRVSSLEFPTTWTTTRIRSIGFFLLRSYPGVWTGQAKRMVSLLCMSVPILTYSKPVPVIRGLRDSHRVGCPGFSVSTCTWTRQAGGWFGFQNFTSPLRAWIEHATSRRREKGSPFPMLTITPAVRSRQPRGLIVAVHPPTSVTVPRWIDRWTNGSPIRPRDPPMVHPSQTSLPRVRQVSFSLPDSGPVPLAAW